MMKKIGIILATVVMMFLFAFSTSAATEGYYTYSVPWYDSTATITDADESISGDVIIPDTLGGYPVTSIGNSAFRDCSSLTSITIPDSVTSIGSSAFSGCSGLTCITIPDSVTSIDGSAFSGCSGLTSVTIPNSVTSIGSFAFSYCSSLTSITIPDSVTSIGNYAFFSCSGLTNITIGDSVTLIGDRAFHDCVSLTDVYAADVESWLNISFSDYYSTPMYYAENLYFGNELVKDVVIPDGVNSIRNFAFYGCSSLTSITIPDSITTIENYNFTNKTMIIANKESYALTWAQNNDRPYAYLNPEAPEENVVFEKVNNKLSYSIDKLTRTLTVTCNGSMPSFGSYDAPWKQYYKYIFHIIVENGCTNIRDYAFEDLYYAKNVSLSDSVTSIREGAFYDCSSLTSITIPDSVTSIGDSAFYDCIGLTSITIPDSVTSIGDSAFRCCESLTDVYAADVESWLNISFKNSYSNPMNYAENLYFREELVNDVVIPDGITTIGYFAFYGCSDLTSITIPDSVISIDVSAFYGCSSLTSITIPDSVTSIGNSAFSYCSDLTSITIPCSITSIGSNAFYNCTNLRDIIIFSTDCYFSGKCGINYTQTLYGFVGSDVESLAEEYGLNFIDVETIHTHEYEEKEHDDYCSYKKCWCGKTEVADHTEVTDSAVAATCTKTGLTEGKKCSICGTVTVAQQTVKAMGHSYAAATCTVPKTCKVCKATTGKANGHKYSNACDTSCNTCNAKRTITHSYKSTTTKATLTKNGKVVNKCAVCGKVKSTTVIYYPKTIKLEYTSVAYNGKAKSPKVTVKDSKGNTLKKDTDYTVKYTSGRKSIGKYTVTVTFKGKYSGTKKLTFEIVPAKVTLSKLTLESKQLTATWKSVSGITGYEVQYSTSKKFTSKTTKTVKIKSAKTKKTTIKKLSKGNKYYVRVRAYKTVNKKPVYGAWSSVKSVKVK